jgi:hypothetical protein
MSGFRREWVMGTFGAVAKALLFLAIGVALLVLSQEAFAQDTKPSVPSWGTPVPTGLIIEPTLLRKLANASDGLVTADREPKDGLQRSFAT